MEAINGRGRGRIEIAFVKGDRGAVVDGAEMLGLVGDMMRIEMQRDDAGIGRVLALPFGGDIKTGGTGERHVARHVAKSVGNYGGMESRRQGQAIRLRRKGGRCGQRHSNRGDKHSHIDSPQAPDERFKRIVHVLPSKGVTNVGMCLFPVQSRIN